VIYFSVLILYFVGLFLKPNKRVEELCTLSVFTGIYKQSVHAESSPLRTCGRTRM